MRTASATNGIYYYKNSMLQKVRWDGGSYVYAVGYYYSGSYKYTQIRKLAYRWQLITEATGSGRPARPIRRLKMSVFMATSTR